jgi:hypothetical protein
MRWAGHVARMGKVLCLTKHYAMKTYCGEEVQLHVSSDLGTTWL